MEAMNSANGAVGSKEVDFYAFVPLSCEGFGGGTL